MLLGMTGVPAWADSVVDHDKDPQWDQMRRIYDARVTAVAEASYLPVIKEMAPRLGQITTDNGLEFFFSALDQKVPKAARSLVFARISELSGLSLAERDLAKLRYDRHLAKIGASALMPQLAGVGEGSTAVNLLRRSFGSEIPPQISDPAPSRGFRSFPRR